MMSLHLFNHSTIITESFVHRFIATFKCLQWSLRHADSVSRCVLACHRWCMTPCSIETSCGDCTCVVWGEREDGNCDEHKSYRKIIHLIHFWAEKATRRQHAKRGSEKGQKSRRDDFISSGKIFQEKTCFESICCDRQDIKSAWRVLKMESFIRKCCNQFCSGSFWLGQSGSGKLLCSRLDSFEKMSFEHPNKSIFGFRTGFRKKNIFYIQQEIIRQFWVESCVFWILSKISQILSHLSRRYLFQNHLVTLVQQQPPSLWMTFSVARRFQCWIFSAQVVFGYIPFKSQKLPGQTIV